MTIFYNNDALQNAMVITLSNIKVNRVENHENYTLLFNNNELVGLNIFNVNESLNLANGMLYPTQEIIDFIKQTTNLDLTNYIQPTFVVAEIVECEDVPNTHLHKCQVNVGDQTLQIVCGAANARVGLKTVCAKVGSVMPNGSYINDGELMSIPSHGMLCSARELKVDINQDKPGILELDSNYKIGETFKPIFKNL